MDKEKLYQELESLERKIHILVSRNEQLNKDLHLSQKENENLKSVIENQSKKIGFFQNQMKISNIAKNMVDGTDLTRLREEIGDYIRELDKCITHLAE